MTREEAIKSIVEWMEKDFKPSYDYFLPVLKCFANTDAEYVNFEDTRYHLIDKTGQLYYERFFDQWYPEPEPYYPKSFTCRSLL